MPAGAASRYALGAGGVGAARPAPAASLISASRSALRAPRSAHGARRTALRAEGARRGTRGSCVGDSEISPVHGNRPSKVSRFFVTSDVGWLQGVALGKRGLCLVLRDYVTRIQENSIYKLSFSTRQSTYEGVAVSYRCAHR
jgi:hypothetical protein